MRETKTNGVREIHKQLKTDGDTICISKRERDAKKGSRERKLVKMKRDKLRKRELKRDGERQRELT